MRRYKPDLEDMKGWGVVVYSRGLSPREGGLVTPHGSSRMEKILVTPG
ncbi:MULTISPECIES: hypothetical protein [Metallosphaera]|nr:hypothetical protein [Metallosphaera sedula]MCP6727709.1 hypothetical protein [Metallosphaera sedula]